MATECKLTQQKNGIQRGTDSKYEGEYTITEIENIVTKELETSMSNNIQNDNNYGVFNKDHFQKNIVNNKNRPLKFSYHFKGIKFFFKGEKGNELNYYVADEICGGLGYYTENGLHIFEKEVLKNNWGKFTEEVYNLLLADNYDGFIERNDGTPTPKNINEEVKKELSNNYRYRALFTAVLILTTERLRGFENLFMAIIVFRTLKGSDFDENLFSQLMYFITGKVSYGDNEHTLLQCGGFVKVIFKEMAGLKKDEKRAKAMEVDKISELMRNAVGDATPGMSLPFFMTGINSTWFNKYGIKNKFNKQFKSLGNYKKFVVDFINKGQPFSYKEYLAIKSLISNNSKIEFECVELVAVMKEGFKNNLSSSTAIPTTITIIRQEAFAETMLTHVELTNVVSIEDKAFINCSSLREVKLPDCLHVIGNSAFEGCTNMASITLSKKLEQLGTDVFKECNSLARDKIINLDFVDIGIKTRIEQTLGIGDDDNSSNNNDSDDDSDSDGSVSDGDKEDDEKTFYDSYGQVYTVSWEDYYLLKKIKQKDIERYYDILGKISRNEAWGDPVDIPEDE